MLPSYIAADLHASLLSRTDFMLNLSGCSCDLCFLSIPRTSYVCRLWSDTFSNIYVCPTCVSFFHEDLFAITNDFYDQWYKDTEC